MKIKYLAEYDQYVIYLRGLVRIYIHKNNSDLCNHLTNKFKLYRTAKDIRGFCEN